MGKWGEYNPPVLFHCASCGAAIRAGEKYHKIYIKGISWEFCTLCIGLSEYIPIALSSLSSVTFVSS